VAGRSDHRSQDRIWNNAAAFTDAPGRIKEALLTAFDIQALYWPPPASASWLPG
jgi:hypothetical protein